MNQGTLFNIRIMNHFLIELNTLEDDQKQGFIVFHKYLSEKYETDFFQFVSKLTFYWCRGQ